MYYEPLKVHLQSHRYQDTSTVVLHIHILSDIASSIIRSFTCLMNVQGAYEFAVSITLRELLLRRAQPRRIDAPDGRSRVVSPH